MKMLLQRPRLTHVAEYCMRQDATLNRRTKLKAQRIDAPLHRCIKIQRLKLYLFSGRGGSGLKWFALRGGVFLHAILHDGSRKK